MKLLALVVSMVLLVIGALIRAAGASVVRTSRADALHDAADGDDRAARIATILDDRAGIQPALGTVTTVLLVAAAVPAAWALTQQLTGIALLAGLVALGSALVAVGDLLPRSWGRAHPGTLAYRFSGLLSASVRLGSRAVDLVTEEEEREEAEVVTDEVAQEEAERELISSVLEFTDAVVREIMVPRPDVTFIAETSSSDEAIDVSLEEGFSRIPVTRAGPDDIVGILYARDLLALMDSGGEARAVREMMRPGYYVPETKRISELLREMQGNQVHMAIVVDEFGGTAGLVTIEDIIEELVGEIADEFDEAEELVTAVDGGAYLVDARLPVDDLGELFDVEFPDEEWDTVGGLVLALAGRVPKEGEQFEHDGVVFTADRVQGRRIARVLCERP